MSKTKSMILGVGLDKMDKVEIIPVQYAVRMQDQTPSSALSANYGSISYAVV